ncbi:MAG: hypothetical protein UU16_C0001G0001 [Candidatus Woesebacteria bacterium GW2011_GWA2_40_7]|uniref:Uncharacterized protein n=3 Tax=Candidatus Woeseibacteriota TaxID=1752722 RepID=A0A0G0PQW0_9BACT|nr:MAG: hypothetical protein UT17_C0004G0089 [Candidatus Woesebacteria bacterium GW2011_GWB1_39_10]KKR74350.1 MAG: hypothetical protein UU16_C0001G0001 [Candidatus Woesebacteria bacterium GW2011_GWA2_40_7]KKS90733.1 MAG: hypothetical protein UV66_C0001G0090 [Candidatus Woesebacteria bacterium GW2011_GWA1_43_12]
MRNEKSWEEIGLGCLGAIALVVILVVVSAFITTLVWGWVVPQVFPTAIANGLLPASLSLVQAFKLSILFGILGLTGASASSSSSKTSYSGCGERVAVAAIAFLIWIPLAAIVIAFSAWLVTLAWGWVVPDVFSGAVAQQLIPATLGFWHAVMLNILFSVLGLSSHRASSSSSKK